MPTRPPLQVSASIVTAELLRLEQELDRLRDAGVESIHIDLEDGVFVPEFNLGVRIADAVLRWGGLPVDVHLMVSDPEGMLELLGDRALRTVAVHLESTRYPRRVLALVKERGWRASLAVNPASGAPSLANLAPHLDEVLLLTTEPERGSAPFLESALADVAAVAAEARAMGARVVVDGGVSAGNADAVARAGADAVVVGRALFASAELPSLVARISKGTP